MKNGQQVRLIQPEVKGTVTDVIWDQDKGEPVALVQLAEDQQRWIPASQLEEIEG